MDSSDRETVSHGHDHGAHQHAHGSCCDHDHGHHTAHATAVRIPVGAAELELPAEGALAWTVGGMDCGSCVRTIEAALGRVPGVSDIRVSLTNETVSLRLDGARTAPAEIAALIGRLGYEARPLGTVAPSLAETGPRWWATGKGRAALASGVLLALAYGVELVAPRIGPFVFLAATLVAAAPVARRAFAAARAGAPFTIQGLMVVAVLGALAIGATEEAAVVVFLFCVGEVLEGVAAEQARAGIKALAALVPKTALVEDAAGQITEVQAGALALGQTVLVRPGDRIPADGVVLSGRSSVDESPITGESMPKGRGPGEEVFAGSINQEAALRVTVRREARDNTIARILALVTEAQEAKAPVERVIDRFSRIYMPAVIALAVLVAAVPPLVAGGAWDVWLYRALTLLLIACPCALVISVPAAMAASLSSAARHGLLVKGGAVIERLAAVDLVAFDKTGTLTRGRPAVTDVIPVEGRGAKGLLALAAAAEQASSHPLARAVLGRAAAEGIAPPSADDARAVPGEGVEATVMGERAFVGGPRFAAMRAASPSEMDVARLEAEGKTVAAVVADGRLVGVLAFRDEPRADARAGVDALKGLGLRTMMLTGDNARAGGAVGVALGVEVRAGMLPQDKAAAVHELAKTNRVAMVGDGINDAPALAAAHVGIAMGAGTEAALETADAALLRNAVGDVATLVRLSRATMANVRQNITIALGLKAIFLVTTVTGSTGLWLAILADTGGTVLVTLNALRLLAFLRADERSRDGTAV